MKTFLYLVSISCFMFSCTEKKVMSFVVEDLTKDTVFTSIYPSGNPLGKITIYVKGEVDDTIRVNHTYFEGGKIDTAFQQDWYTKEVAIFYFKYKAKKGRLAISYQ